MALLTTQVVSLSGLTRTFSAASGGGDTFVPGDGVCLQVKNAGGSPVTVTVVTPNTVGGLAIADSVSTVPATTGDVLIGPFSRENFARPSDGLGEITYSGVTSVTVAVVDVRR